MATSSGQRGRYRRFETSRPDQSTSLSYPLHAIPDFGVPSGCPRSGSLVACQLRASALELYAADVSFAFVVAASPGLFGTVHGAHEPLVRFFEPITLGPLDAEASTRAITEPLAAASVRFDADVVAEIVELSGGRPYYLQKLAYYGFDASEHGQVGQVQFAVAFEQAFASVSQEIFAARWSAMAVIERRVVSVVASSAEARSSGDIESAAAQHGIRPDATRQALRRLVAPGPRRAPCIWAAWPLRRARSAVPPLPRAAGLR